MIEQIPLTVVKEIALDWYACAYLCANQPDDRIWDFFIVYVTEVRNLKC